jgi:hypothetical protein
VATNIPVLVDPEVTRTKFTRELGTWKKYGADGRRGWILLSENADTLSVEVGFLGRIMLSASTVPLSVVPVALRITFENYDLWPPSVTFIDPQTREPSPPHVRAIVLTTEGPRDVLIDGHPVTQRPFLCIPGIREYHNHPQHSGDGWLIHRATGAGHLLNICDRVSRFMVSNIVGLNVGLQVFPFAPLQAQVSVLLAQGELANLPSPRS